MIQQKPDSGFDCEIKFKNHLDDCWQIWFDGLLAENLADGEVLISGSLSDSAALFGLLNKIRDLNLKVISLVIRARNR